MQDPFRTIEWKDNHIRLLDQTLLPREERYLDIYEVDELCSAIKKLAVRGAPAIGVAAAMGVALGMLKAPRSRLWRHCRLFQGFEFTDCGDSTDRC